MRHLFKKMKKKKHTHSKYQLCLCTAKIFCMTEITGTKLTLTSELKHPDELIRMGVEAF